MRTKRILKRAFFLLLIIVILDLMSLMTTLPLVDDVLGGYLAMGALRSS